MKWINMVLMVSVIGILRQESTRGDDDNSAVVCEVAAVSNANPLPFEPIGVLISLRNTTETAQKVRDSKGVPGIRLQYPDSTVRYATFFVGSPLINNYVTLAPKRSTGKISTVHYLRHRESEHAFPTPGVKIMIEGYWGDIYSGYHFGIDVQTLSGRDIEAYDALKSTELPKGFCCPSSNMPGLPDTLENISTMEKFIKDYHDSRYANLARIGLGLLHNRMSEAQDYDEATKSWVKSKETALHMKKAREIFQQIVNDYKRQKEEKVDQGNDKKEETGIAEGQMAPVDKDAFFWASCYETWCYERPIKFGQRTTPAMIAEWIEQLKHNLKGFEYALSQEPNEYWKFTFQPLREGTAAEIKKIEDDLLKEGKKDK